MANKSKLLVILGIISALTFFCTCNKENFSINPVSASVNQSEKQEELITSIENTTSEERKKIFEDNRNIINSDFIISILKKANEHFDVTSVGDKSKKLIQIAVEASEFTGDNISLAKSLLHRSTFDIFEKKGPESPDLEKALKLFIREGDRRGEACCYIREAGKMHYISGKPEKALEFLDKSISILKEINNELRTGDCYFLKGEIYKDTGDKDKALEYMKKAMTIYEKKGYISGILQCYQVMVYINQFNGFLEEAENCLDGKRKFIEEIEPDKIKDFSTEGDGYNFRESKIDSKDRLMMDYYMSLASIYSMMGKYEQAINSYKQTIETGKKMDKRGFSEMLAYWHTGGLYLSLGQKDTALKYYLEAMSKNSENIPAYQVVSNYVIIGGFYLKEMKDPDEALKYYEIAMKESEKIESPLLRDPFKGICISSMGQVYLEKGEYDKAIEKIDKALKSFEELYKNYGGIGQFDYYLVSNYDLLGKVYQKKGDQKKALFYMNKAIECAEKHAAFATKPSAYNHLGNFYYETEEYLKALETYKEALKGAEDIRSPSLLWEYYFSIGKTYEKLGNLKEAYNAYNNSINIIENMRNEFKVEELKRDFMQDKIKVYEHMIDILIKMKKEDKAFDCNERCRSRAFLDILANQKVDIRHGISSELAKKEAELTGRIQFLSSDIRQEKAKPVSSQISAFIEERDSTLKKLKIEYRQLLEEIKMENPEYMTLITINPLTLEEIKSLLDKDTVIVEYFVGENKSYCWITGNNSFNTVIINHKQHDIENLVKKYREVACDNMTAEKLKSNEWKEISEKLYTILFKELEKYMKKRILISPHKILHYLPFQVMSDDKGRMLVEKYDISYLPSASVLKYCQKKNTLKKEKLLAFDLGNFKAGELPPLPGTEGEVKAISQYFPLKEIYSGKDMSAEILYKKGKDFDLLHLATHGILDRNSPLFSSLVFSDRRLNVYEIFDLDLKTYLVTLSACKTGFSEDASGDELIGLSRAFIYAGTPTICSSLWDVSDRATSELMKSFYFHLRDKNKTEALKLAQLDIMKKYHHPFFWAPFVLTGDWR